MESYSDASGMGDDELDWKDDPPPIEEVDLLDVLGQLKESEEWIETTETVSSGAIRWRPYLWSNDRTCVLHVHLVDELRSYLRERLQMAASVGKQIVVALQLKTLYQYEIVEFLGEIQADVIVINVNNGLNTSEAENLLTALSDRAVPVRHETRSMIARRAWNDRAVGSSNQKGRRFEGLMAFLLGQVSDFRVVERNFRGETDEIDIIVQIDNWSTRCWQLPGSPFVLVEAKNWADPVDQSAVTVFNGKLRTKRQTARLGLMFAASRFTSDAEKQLLKFAQEREIVALIDGKEIVEWIDSTEPEEYLEKLVRRAMLK